MARLQTPGVVVQRAMNVVMPLKDPSAKGKAALVQTMGNRREAIDSGLNAVGTIHFARFTLIEGALLMIAIHDGGAESYIREFAVDARRRVRRPDGARRRLAAGAVLPRR